MSKKINSVVYYLLSATVLIVTILALYPFLQNYVDPDATSYFTIVKRYLSGDTENAINAFWSPMGIWLTVLVVKYFGLNYFPAAILVNTIACLGTLWSTQFLFHRFRSNLWERILFAVFFGLFWAYADYKQSFTDIWQYFFLFLYFLLLTHKDFFKKWYYWIGLGMIAALAYFSKAYAFYYSLLLLSLFLFLEWKFRKNISFQKAVSIGLVVFTTQILIALPWILALYQKYGMFTLSTAGNLNLSWWLTGHQIYKEGIKAVIPPAVPNGVFCFEDPYLYQGELPKFWHSPALFLKQIIRSAYNYIGWNESAFILSSFYFTTWIWSLVYFFSKDRWKEKGGIQQVWLFFISYPLAFWLMTFDEGRYLWLTIPLMCIILLFLLDKFVFPHIATWGKILLTIALFLSVMVEPARDLKEMWHAGKTEKEWAQQLNDMGIKGSFVANFGYNKTQSQFILRLAYFADCPWYCQVEDKWNTQDVLTDAERYQVPYFFYFYSGTGEDYELKDNQGKPFPELTQGSIQGLKVFQLR